MRTTKFGLIAFIAIIAIGLSVTSCKKDNTTTPATTSLSETDLMSQSTSDDQEIQDIQNIMDKNVTDYMSGLSLTKGSNDSTPPCGMQIVGTPDLLNKTYTLKYDGTLCVANDPIRRKIGVIVITLTKGNHWKEIGAVLNIKYDIAVTKRLSGKTFNIKGERTIENVKGGRWWDLITGDTLVHKINASNIITFPNGTTRQWKHKVIRAWVLPAPKAPLLFIVSAWGDTLGYKNLATWGINRNGNYFFTQITSPIIAASACNWDPSMGACKHTLTTSDTTYTATLKFGLDANGNQILPSSQTCPDHFKINWTGRQGKKDSTLLSY